MFRDKSQCDKCGDKNRTPGKNLCQCSHVQGMDKDDLHLVYLATYQLCVWFRQGVGISHPKSLCDDHQLTIVIANILPFFFFSPVGGKTTKQRRRSSLRLSSAWCDPHMPATRWVTLSVQRNRNSVSVPIHHVCSRAHTTACPHLKCPASNPELLQPEEAHMDTSCQDP